MPQVIGSLKHMPWVPTRPQLGSVSLKLVKNETDPSPKSTCVEVKLACMGRKLAHPLAIGTNVRFDDVPQGIGGLLKHMPWVPTQLQLGSVSLKNVKNETDPSPKITCAEAKLACMGRKLAHPLAIGTICEV